MVIVEGRDQRVRLDALGERPHNAICLIQTGYAQFPDTTGYGTGFLIGNGRIVTAAHVLWNRADDQVLKPRLPDTIDVFVGEGLYSDDGAGLHWTLDRTAATIHPKFKAGDKSFDVAKLQLPDQPAAALGLFGFPAGLAAGDQLTISGYPIDREPFGAYEAAGPLNTLDASVFRHQVDTYYGQSGAPVRVLRNGSWQVVGIHLGDGDDGQHRNRGLALSPEITSWLHA